MSVTESKIGKEFEELLSFDVMYFRFHKNLSFFGKIYRAFNLPPNTEFKALILQEYHTASKKISANANGKHTLCEDDQVILKFMLCFNIYQIILHCTCPPNSLFCAFNKPYLPLWSFVMGINDFTNKPYEPLMDSIVIQSLEQLDRLELTWLEEIIRETKLITHEWLKKYSKYAMKKHSTCTKIENE